MPQLGPEKNAQEAPKEGKFDRKSGFLLITGYLPIKLSWISRAKYLNLKARSVVSHNS